MGKNKQSNIITEIVTATLPQLLVDGGTTSTRQQGQTFHLTGTCYTPGGQVRRFIQLPNQSVQEISSLTATSAGTISWDFTSSCTTPLGNTQVWTLDVGKNLQSNVITETVTLGPGCAPLITITPSAGSQGTTFRTNGSGFTPNRTVTRHLLKPNGQEIILTPAISADSNGNISWDFTSTCATPVGTSQLWVVDDTTGISSNTVTQTVTQGSGCP